MRGPCAPFRARPPAATADTSLVGRPTRIDSIADQRRLARLHAVLRTYAGLVTYLPEILEAVRAAYPSTNTNHLVDGYVQRDVREFGKDAPATDDVGVLGSDLWTRIEARLGSAFEEAPDLRAALDRCGAAVTTTPLAPIDTLEHYREIGERLSRACYGQVASHHQNLLRGSELRYRPGAERKIYCSPGKDDGTSTITVELSPGVCTLDDYLNLPFYFLHEHLSHVHSGKTYAEAYGAHGEFVEGWLLYAAEAFYREALAHGTGGTELSHPAERRAAVGRYVARVQTNPDRPSRERDAYDHAKTFREDALDGDPFFWELTLRFALAPFDAAKDRGVRDLHDELVHRMGDRGALRRFFEDTQEGKRESLRLWRHALAQPDNLGRLLDLLPPP